MEKLNIVELLKDCPKGMELDCTLLEGLEFDDIIDNEYLPIRCRVKNPDGGYNVYNFTKYGCWLTTTFAKCVIFPKGKTTWEGFVPPSKFKDGDVISVIINNYLWYGIYQKEFNNLLYCYVSYSTASENIYPSNKIHMCSIDRISEIRFATEEEKEKLFQAIKDNGYKWNEETKTLEKLPKFKVGDRIILKDNPHNIPSIRIKSLTKNQYILENEGFFYIDDDKKYILEDKFDISTLVPFESRVLVRNDEYSNWRPAVFGGCTKNRDNEIEYYYALCSTSWRNCIPYEGNEHLLGTTDDCDEYYKTW